MEITTWFEIIVIALSVLLGLFLILAIVAVALVLKLIASLRRVVAKSESLVDSAEELGETLRRNAGAVGIVKLLLRFVSATTKRKG